jgi:membrane fusion protein, adhesin transport system
VKTQLAPQQDLTSVSADLVEIPLGRSKFMIYVIACILGGGLVWSYFAETLEVATGTGLVVPEQHVQIIQSLDGGDVRDILVRNGDHVEAGQVLVKLDPTFTSASRDEVMTQLAGLQAAGIRAKAMLDGADPRFPDELQKLHPQLIEQNMQQFRSGMAQLSDVISVVERQIAQRRIDLSEARVKLKGMTRPLQIAKQDFATMRKLAQQGAAGRIEVSNAESRYLEFKSQSDQLRLSLSKLKEAIAELESQRSQTLSSFKQRNGEILVETDMKIASLTASLKSQQRRLDQTSIKAPSSGTLKSVSVTNLGQVVRPGEKVAEIVPDGAKLVVQAKVRPDDIAFLEKGMPTLVKLTAYEFSVFGPLQGRLKRIAADSVTDERGQTYYMVDVELDQTSITRKNVVWPIKSGMVASVEIVTGKHSILQYFTKPIHRMALVAMRER